MNTRDTCSPPRRCVPALARPRSPRNCRPARTAPTPWRSCPGAAPTRAQQKAYAEPYAPLTGSPSPGRAPTRRWPSCAPRPRPATSPRTSWTSRARTASASATRAWRGDRLRRGAGPGRRRLDPDRGLRRRAHQRLLRAADRLLDHLRLPHRRRRVERQEAGGPLRRLRPRELPGKRSLEKRPKKNLEWALLCDGVAKEDLYDVSPPRKAWSGRSPSSTPSRTR